MNRSLCLKTVESVTGCALACFVQMGKQLKRCEALVNDYGLSLF